MVTGVVLAVVVEPICGVVRELVVVVVGVGGVVD